VLVPKDEGCRKNEPGRKATSQSRTGEEEGAGSVLHCPLTSGRELIWAGRRRHEKQTVGSFPGGSPEILSGTEREESEIVKCKNE